MVESNVFLISCQGIEFFLCGWYNVYLALVIKVDIFLVLYVQYNLDD